MRTFLFLNLILVFTACSNRADSGRDTMQAFFSGIIGEWLMDDHPVIEKWEKDGDLYRSTVFTISGNDTVISEQVKIIEIKDEIYYEATVRGQNQGKPVLFKLITSTAEKLIFENKTHDFPQQIIYKLDGKDKLLATIQGNENGKLKVFKFKYSKIKY